jgi:hypothetical protein
LKFIFVIQYNFNMNRIYLSLILYSASFLFLSCQKRTDSLIDKQIEIDSEDELGNPYTPPGEFDSYLYWRKLGQAFFSKDAKDELRRLRNEIYARHGRIFEDADLQRYFEKESWYRRNPTYQDSLLSPMEKEYVTNVQQSEQLLDNLPEDFKEKYDAEVSFRMRDKVDTLFVFNRDYTGDGIAETQYTRIFKNSLHVLTSNTIIAKNDTIFIKVDTVSFAPIFSDYNELLTDYSLMLEFAPLEVEMSDQNGLYDFIFPTLAGEISAHTGTDTTEFVAKMKDYVRELQGKLFHMATSESGGCAYMWYAPINRFVTFYCP